MSVNRLEIQLSPTAVEKLLLVDDLSLVVSAHVISQHEDALDQPNSPFLAVPATSGAESRTNDGRLDWSSDNVLRERPLIAQRAYKGLIPHLP